ncbi:myelin-associated oligodendrocyte basic protein isoform 1-T1 [Ctenodactylus gundi]
MSQKAPKEGPRLSKNQRLSEHFSIRCCPPFTFLNSKREVVDRKYSLCRSGCFYQKQEEDWVCCACQRTRWVSRRPARPPAPPPSFGPFSTSRRAKSPRRPQRAPASPPAVVRAPAKPRSPPRSERPPRPRPEVRSPPAKPRPAPKAKPAPRSSPPKGPGARRGGSPGPAARFW